MKISRITVYRVACYLGAASIVTTILIIGSPSIFGHLDEARFRNLDQKDAVRSLNERIDKQGAEKTWAYLQKAYLSDGVLIAGNSDAHSLAHAIGGALYKERGLAALSICTDVFTDGCYHGVIEEMTTEQGLSAVTGVGALCLEQPKPRTCAHGAGHAISEAAEFDLADALSYCDEFPHSLTSDCAEGAIMANSWRWKYKGDIIEKEPWAICASLLEKYQVVCASAIGSYFANEAGKVYTSAYMASMCMNAPTEEMSSMCLSRVSQRIVKNAHGKVDAIKEECRTMPDSQYQECVIFAARFERSLRYINSETSTAELCTLFFAESYNACPLKDEVRSDG